MNIKSRTLFGPKLTLLTRLLIIALSINSSILIAQTADERTHNAFDTAITRFATSDPLKHGSWGLCVIDVSTGSIYRGVNEHLSLIPASTLKPFTSAAVLSSFGKDHRFRTEIAISGTIDTAGILHGNLYIIGGGDPTLGAAHFGSEVNLDSLFTRVLASLRDSGIIGIQGSIIGDASYFDKMPVITSWQYEDIGNHYGAVSAGLSVYDNGISFTFEPGKRVGDPAMVVRSLPEAPYLEVINEVTTGPRGSGDKVYIYGAPFSNFRWLTGTVPAGVKEFTVTGTLPDPAYHAAFALHEFLAASGISILKQPTTALRMEWMGIKDTLMRRAIITHLSPRLIEIVNIVNFRSNNMYAEVLVKNLGKQRYGDGTTEAGLKAVLNFWQRSGLDLSGVNIKDGSGLSRKNNITANVLAAALALYAADSNYGEFSAAFPLAGETGNIAGRFKRGAARGNLRAKSGTLEKVKAFSGYATSASGRQFSFALIVNNYSGSHNELMKEIEILLNKICEIND